MGLTLFSRRDETLVAQALKGSDKAWFSLISRYESAMFHYALRMTGNADDASDLMQDVFISVYRSLERYRGEGTFKSWLYRIAHCRCVEYYRKQKEAVDIDEVPELAAVNTCPEVAMYSNQQSKQLIHAMQTLPLSQKAVVELKFFGQFTFDEIAQQLNVSVNTAKSRLYSALGKLKLELE